MARQSRDPSQLDSIAVTIVEEGIWYLIPVRALAGRLTIHLYPFGSRRRSRKGFEKYRGAWDLSSGEPALRRLPGSRKRAQRIRSRIGLGAQSLFGVLVARSGLPHPAAEQNYLKLSLAGRF
jgi:hypothetical protein